MARGKLFKMESGAPGRACTMREHSFQRIGTEIVMRMQMRIY